jgi:hypothetical protein
LPTSCLLLVVSCWLLVSDFFKIREDNHRD